MNLEVLMKGEPMSLVTIMGVISNIHNPNTPAALTSESVNKNGEKENIPKGIALYNLYNSKAMNITPDSVKNGWKKKYHPLLEEETTGEVSHTFLRGDFPDYLLREFKNYGISFR